MKKLTWIASSFLLGAVLATGGCGKSKVETRPAFEINGVKVDIPALQETFATGTPEQQANARDAASTIRYGQYERALMALDKLVTDASLTEPQKKVVNQVIEQVKQLINKGPAK